VDGYDRWAYVGGDPVNLWDPWGLAAAPERARSPFSEVDPDLSEAQQQQRAESAFLHDIWSNVSIVASHLAFRRAAALYRGHVELLHRLRFGVFSLAAAARQSQSAYRDRSAEVGSGQATLEVLVQVAPVVPEVQAVITSGGEDPTAILDLAAAVVGTLAGAMAPGGAAGAARGAQQAAGQGFRSFSAFKRALGPAGPGRQWHHIVEQGGNVERFGAGAIHNTSNLVRVDTAVHRQISGFYSSKQPFTGGQTVRQWLRSQSFDEQMQFGLDTLRRFGGGQ
jgi:hypothetical protein